jgi:hypothetical protein
MVASASTTITELYTDGPNVYWGERRPQDGGKACIVAQEIGRDGKRENRKISPDGANVGNRVHEYLLLHFISTRTGHATRGTQARAGPHVRKHTRMYTCAHNYVTILILFLPY